MNLIGEIDVLSDIVKTVFPNIKQYENDVPQNFKRPCFLFIRPDKRTETRELTKFAYEQTKTYTIYGFCKDGDVEALTTTKYMLIDYIMGHKKYLIPGSDNRYFTIDVVSADTDDVNSFTEYTIRVKQTLRRDLRQPSYEKIMHVKNNIKPEEG